MSLAVPGINCINPCAPLSDSARGLNALSAWMIARRNASSTPYSMLAVRIASAYAVRLSDTLPQRIVECRLHAAQVAM
jgi:hypothetical protein